MCLIAKMIYFLTFPVLSLSRDGDTENKELLRESKSLDVIHNGMKSTGVDESDREEYRGKYLGKLNAYHHQVAGDVYVVDEYTLLLISFSYDGNGADTFFWAGASNRPGPQGFIVPDEWGKSVSFCYETHFAGGAQNH